jgi:hypothetical protein
MGWLVERQHEGLHALLGDRSLTLLEAPRERLRAVLAQQGSGRAVRGRADRSRPRARRGRWSRSAVKPVAQLPSREFPDTGAGGSATRAAKGL